MDAPEVLLESRRSDQDGVSFSFSGCVDQVAAACPGEVNAALEEVERAVSRGLHAAGFIAYEAASGLDPALKTRSPDAAPLVWFGLFERRTEPAAGRFCAGRTYSLSAWRPSITDTEYADAVAGIREYIAAGDTYQVNYSYRLRADFEGDAGALYSDLRRSQRTAYSAFVDTGRFQVLSVSPELFFRLKSGELSARPMKGTRRRGRWPGEDRLQARALRNSPKDRAENVMIVDMLRNDLGRVSETGSVRTPVLWDVERYETVLQMTSTVRSRLRGGVGVSDVLRAAFPCGSVTGAPKVRTMEIISELEDSPRGVYTGSIGYISPGPEAQFNVAIRTVTVDRETALAEFGVGSGVTHDSSTGTEYEECRTKARFLTDSRIIRPGSANGRALYNQTGQRVDAPGSV
ncbi:MAG: aminodeoxychorismate synthase component I [Gemmatimonadetes bacterium]|nr:aminodeoxychorismate synthase component I [Gemmatimonadota bacterium]MDE3258397.1 aminodeoxychorismate synthase component I [Gemmatimonadota bacterium]